MLFYAINLNSTDIACVPQYQCCTTCICYINRCNNPCFGYFNLYCSNETRLLPRPISICAIDKDRGTIRIVYRLAGEGTREFSTLKAGDSIEILGPLGNGFTVREEPAILIGGGIGIPPMLELAKSIPGPKTCVLGYRDEPFLLEEFEKISPVAAASEDGKTGVMGTVLDAIRHQGVEGKVIYACGPMPMLKAVAEYAREKGLEAQVSLEERMACGIGACLGCICQTREKNHHTNVNNSRVCKDGPVFDAKEVVFP